MRFLFCFLLFFVSSVWALGLPAGGYPNYPNPNPNMPNPPPNPNGVQTSPGVTLQNNPETVKQVHNFFDHAKYSKFKKQPKLKLFSIPHEVGS